ncbi:MAG: hypothetical protein WAX89_01890 [Alphaproteobacteria bacterium]
MLDRNVYIPGLDFEHLFEDLVATTKRPLVPCHVETLKECEEIILQGENVDMQFSVLATPQNHLRLVSYCSLTWRREPLITRHPHRQFGPMTMALRFEHEMLPNDVIGLKRKAPLACYYIIVPQPQLDVLRHATLACGFPIVVNENITAPYMAENTTCLGIACSAEEVEKLVAYLQEQQITALMQTHLRNPRTGATLT